MSLAFVPLRMASLSVFSLADFHRSELVDVPLTAWPNRREAHSRQRGYRARRDRKAYTRCRTIVPTWSR